MKELRSGRVGTGRRRAWLYAWVSVVALQLSGQPLRGGAVKAGPDVAMTDELVFVADPGRGTVQSGPIKPGRLSLAQLTPMAALNELKRPIAIDARGSRLVVLDAAGPTVMDVDLRTNTAKILTRGAPLREPTGIAIAANGTVAVTDPSNRALFLFSDGKEMQIDRRLSVPLEVEFDPTDEALYVYDGERGLLRLEYSSIDNFLRMRNAERIATTPLTGIARVFSFAPRRGLVYVADENGLRVAIPAKRSTLTVPQQYYRRRFTSIALHTKYLAGIDDAGTSIEIIDRPLPVSVNLDPDNGDPNAGMLALLEYLGVRHLLPGRGVQLDGSAEPYDRVLARYKVLVPASRDGAAGVLDQKRLRSLFCSLNPRRCEGPGGEAADEVTIPQLTIDSYLAVSNRSLGGKSVEQHIEDKVVDPTQRAAVTADYIAKLNPTTDGTLEAELQRRKLVMAMPMSGALSPGTVIRVEGLNETATGDLGGLCGTPPGREASPTFLPETIATRVLASLPDEVRKEAAAAAVSEVELGFDRVVRETIVAAPAECRLKPAAGKQFLIVESVKVDALRYRIARTNASPRARTPIQAQASRAQEWKVVKGPFVIAYKAVEFSSAALALAERAVDPAELKPGLLDGAAILRRNSGEANLPATHWRFDVLVPAPDYLATASPLGDLRRGNPTLGLSSHERVLATSRSTVLRHVSAVTDDVKTTLIEARKNLSKTISYSDDLAAGTEDFYVAIGEADDQVNQDHPGFVHGARSAWFESTPDGLIRRRVPPAAGAGADAALHPLTHVDHGTHVSGIIGARSSSLMPGLTPGVRLYLVDTARNLTDAIQDAYDDGLRIFNFSFALKPDAEVEEEMKRRMIQHWSEALFVVAAGNEGLDLNSGGSQPLVSWVLEVPYIIGVGASRADGLELMGVQPNESEPGATLPGSNFGSRFVQIVAPGQQIYSLGDQQYAFATGTSQAVPQVTAAAAILSARMSGSTVLKIKARLIATTTWRAGYQGKVWGGLLDVDRAVMHHMRNVVRIQSDPQSVRAITLDDDTMLTIKGATTYPSDGTPGVFVNSKKVSIRKILRLEHLGASNFRIVMMDSDRFAIMFGKVEGKIACTEMTQYDRASAQFKPLPAGTPDLCTTGGIPILQLQDYVAKAAAIPERVKF